MEIDNSDWRPIQGSSGGPEGDTSMESGDWRVQLHADSRTRIVNKIMDALKRNPPFSDRVAQQELKEIASKFEEKIYTTATNQSDYLRKISLKMLSMETRSQNPMPDVMHLGYNIKDLVQETQVRWLRPEEVFFLLQKYEEIQLNHEPSQKPPSGSLFLFDKRVNRFFRRDGHSWQKKKDGKTVREAHDRLRVGSVEALACYYAYGEENPNFQRRCYWMLDSTMEHIVLVHYRDITIGANYDLNLSHEVGSLVSGHQPPSISDMVRDNVSQPSGGAHSYSRDHSAPSWNALFKRDSSSMMIESDNVQEFSGDDFGLKDFSEVSSKSKVQGKGW